MSFREYVGIPFVEGGAAITGCDCYGLLRLVYAGIYRIALPDYAVDRADHAGIVRCFEREAAQWCPVALSDARSGDVLWLRVAGRQHVGIVVGQGRMLHVPRGGTAVIDRYTRPQWTRRIRGVYRHAAHV